ncbi:hypothetical protein C8R44DRAFT_889811 [Mycena epipterygia]|nr:hypothetical protein C8R44DRAFT_889811 [Mycena epipterygia]
MSSISDDTSTLEAIEKQAADAPVVAQALHQSCETHLERHRSLNHLHNLRISSGEARYGLHAPIKVPTEYYARQHNNLTKGIWGNMDVTAFPETLENLVRLDPLHALRIVSTG